MAPDTDLAGMPLNANSLKNHTYRKDITVKPIFDGCIGKNGFRKRDINHH